jgi:hypothetical protein
LRCPNDKIEARSFFDPVTLELVLRRRDWSRRDEQHDGRAWPPTEETRIGIPGLLRARGFLPP